MPFNLIVIFTPKTVDVDEDGDVIEPKATPAAAPATTASAAAKDIIEEEGKNEPTSEVEQPKTSIRQSAEVVVDSTKTIRRNSKALSYDSEYSSMKMIGTSDSQGVDGLREGTEAVRNIIEKKDETDALIAEVNVENFLKEALETLRKQEYISTAPTYVEDQSGRNLQVSFVCERGDVDVVIAHLAHIGVGTLVGNVNVMSLESSKFYRKTAEELREELRVAKQAEQAENEAEGGEDKVQEGESKEGAGAPVGEAEGKGGEEKEEDDRDKAAKKIFLEAASQIRVEQIVEQIEVSAGK
jgi:hypothetical protein